MKEMLEIKILWGESEQACDVIYGTLTYVHGVTNACLRYLNQLTRLTWLFDNDFLKRNLVFQFSCRVKCYNIVLNNLGSNEYIN